MKNTLQKTAILPAIVLLSTALLLISSTAQADVDEWTLMEKIWAETIIPCF